MRSHRFKRALLWTLWLPILGACYCAHLAHQYVADRPARHAAESRLILGQTGAAPLEEVYGVPVEVFVRNQVEIIQSAEIQRRAAYLLAASKADFKPGKELPEIHARQTPESTVITVTASSQDETFVTDYLEAVCNEYISFVKEGLASASGQMLNSLLEAVVRKDQAVQAASKALREAESRGSRELLETEVSRLAIFVSDLRGEREKISNRTDVPPAEASALNVRLQSAEAEYEDTSKKLQAIRHATAQLQSEEAAYQQLRTKLSDIDAEVPTAGVQVLERAGAVSKVQPRLLQPIMTGSLLGMLLGTTAMITIAFIWAVTGRKIPGIQRIEPSDDLKPTSL